MNKTQEAIVLCVMDWVLRNKEPISKKTIFDRMKEKGISESTAKASINVLIKKGYLRKAISVKHEAQYVLLRKIVIYE